MWRVKCVAAVCVLVKSGQIEVLPRQFPFPSPHFPFDLKCFHINVKCNHQGIIHKLFAFFYSEDVCHRQKTRRFFIGNEDNEETNEIKTENITILLLLLLLDIFLEPENNYNILDRFFASSFQLRALRM